MFFTGQYWCGCNLKTSESWRKELTETSADTKSCHQARIMLYTRTERLAAEDMEVLMDTLARSQLYALEEMKASCCMM